MGCEFSTKISLPPMTFPVEWSYTTSMDYVCFKTAYRIQPFYPKIPVGMFFQDFNSSSPGSYTVSVLFFQNPRDASRGRRYSYVYSHWWYTYSPRLFMNKWPPGALSSKNCRITWIFRISPRFPFFFGAAHHYYFVLDIGLTLIIKIMFLHQILLKTFLFKLFF